MTQKLKLNKNEENEMDLNTDQEINLPDFENEQGNEKTSESQESTYVIEETQEGRKLFANKKANIALMIAGGVIGVLIVAEIGRAHV